MRKIWRWEDGLTSPSPTPSPYPHPHPLTLTSWEDGVYLGEIPEVAHTYRVVGNMNEHQVLSPWTRTRTVTLSLSLTLTLTLALILTLTLTLSLTSSRSGRPPSRAGPSCATPWRWALRWSAPEPEP